MTQWSVISKARGQDDEDSVEGLRQLAMAYWRPLYLYLRKRGENHVDASDTVQGFFEFVLSSGFLDHVDREGGKFRSYFLSSLERWRSRKRVREGALKRGKQFEHVPLESLAAMQSAPELASDLSAEMTYDRQWAFDLLERAVLGLREQYERRGRQQWFDALRGALPGGTALTSYKGLAESFETTEGTIRKAVHDLRNAFNARLREEIRATVRTNEEAEEELGYLASILASSETASF